MKILLTIDGLTMGGAQVFIIRLANELVANHHKVYIYDHIPSYRDFQLLERLDKRVRLCTHKFTPWMDFVAWKINALAQRLYRPWKFHHWIVSNYAKWHYQWIVWYLNPHVIHSHSVESDWITAQSNLKPPLLITMHGEYELLLAQKPAFPQMAQTILEKVKAIVHVADKNLTIFQYINLDISKRLVEKIYNGFPALSFKAKSREQLGLSPQTMVYGMVSRGLEEKGWAIAIEAFEALQKAYPTREMKLILVGESVYLENLKNYYQNNPHIHFVGYSSQPLEWIQLFDVALLPTYLKAESLPNVMVEYLYCGKPVICSEIGDISQMLTYQNEQAGIILKLNQEGKPQADALQKAMEIYLINPKVYQKHANLAKPAFQKFNMQTCLQSYLKVYNQCLETDG